MEIKSLYQINLIRAAGKAQKKTDKKKHKCLIPNCSEIAISSHSQQRKGQLQAISTNGNVYAVEKNIYRALKKGQKKHTVRFVKVPISTASTFLGFCAKHDSNLFKPIERNSLILDNNEQANLLFLRAHSFEYLQKKRAYLWNEYFLKQIGSQLNPEMIERYHLKMRGMDIYLNSDAPHYFKNVFEAINDKKSNNIESAWIEIPKNINVSVSCCMSPLMTKHIDYMIEHEKDVQPSVTFSVVPNDSSTHVVVSWLKEHSSISGWFKDALSNDVELKMLINQCAFGESEDTCISPVLWDNLSAEHKEMVSKAVMYTRELEIPAPLPNVINI